MTSLDPALSPRVPFNFVRRKTSTRQEPRRHSPPCSSTLNASSCSLTLGHSITKYCFSTCCTKSFLKAAGEACWRVDNRGTVSMEWFASRMLCLMKVTQEPRSTSETSVVTFSSFGGKKKRERERLTVI